MIRPVAALVVLCVTLVSTAQAQWINHPSAGIPRTKDGKPNLSARNADDRRRQAGSHGHLDHR